MICTGCPLINDTQEHIYSFLPESNIYTNYTFLETREVRKPNATNYKSLALLITKLSQFVGYALCGTRSAGGRLEFMSTLKNVDSGVKSLPMRSYKDPYTQKYAQHGRACPNMDHRPILLCGREWERGDRY